MSQPRIRRATPSVPVFYPDWLLLSALHRDVAAALRDFGRGDILDVGCGSKPYEALPHRGSTWIGLDLPDNPLADLHGTAEHIPMADGSVDTVVCSQVLEHVTKPAATIAECARVLRRDGTLILTVPQYWPLHEEPYDFLRYTELGLRNLFEPSGLRIERHATQGRGAAVAGQALNNAMLCAGDTFSCKDALWFKASKAPFYLAVNVLTVFATVILRSKRDVLNHLIVARKLS